MEEIIYIAEQNMFIVNGVPIKESVLTETQKIEFKNKAKIKKLLVDSDPLIVENKKLIFG